MLLTIICTLFFIASIVWAVVESKRKYGNEIAPIVCVVGLGLWFLINTICLFACQSQTTAEVSQFESTRLTIEQQRNNKLSEYERVQLTTLIVERNTWLAKEQYWAKSIWLNWYYDKKILSIKPIQ